MPTAARRQKPNPYLITLTPEQYRHAADAAERLHDRIRKRGGRDAHGARNITSKIEAGGAAAEYAAALALGVSWTGCDSQDARGPDIGKRTQVRSSSVARKSHCLIIRQRDLDKYGDVPFILVIQTGLTFELKGWLMAEEAQQAVRLWNGGHKSRPPAWFVREALLHPMKTLKKKDI